MSESEGVGESVSAVAGGGDSTSTSTTSGGQLADVQRQLAALESRYAALVSKHDDTENDLAFQRKRVESAVNKITADKDDEIAQSQHTTRHNTTQHNTTRHNTTRTQPRARVGREGDRTAAHFDHAHVSLSLSLSCCRCVVVPAAAVSCCLCLCCCPQAEAGVRGSEREEKGCLHSNERVRQSMLRT